MYCLHYFFSYCSDIKKNILCGFPKELYCFFPSLSFSVAKKKLLLSLCFKVLFIFFFAVFRYRKQLTSLIVFYFPFFFFRSLLEKRAAVSIFAVFIPIVFRVVQILTNVIALLFFLLYCFFCCILPVLVRVKNTSCQCVVFCFHFPSYCLSKEKCYNNVSVLSCDVSSHLILFVCIAPSLVPSSRSPFIGEAPMSWRAVAYPFPCAGEVNTLVCRFLCVIVFCYASLCTRR